MNIELLRRVQAAILREPRRFNMHDWFTDEDGATAHNFAYALLDWREDEDCKTAACIAGWSCVLGGVKPEDLHDPKKNAMTVLEITEPQADRLFMVEQWPEAFLTGFERHDLGWEDSRALAAVARIAANRIDHFIATEGKE